MIHKLKYEHLHLTSFSKMRVDLAAQVFILSIPACYIQFTKQVLSQSVAEGLKLTGGPNAQGMAKFIEMADKFFDCLNISNLNEGKEKRKKFRECYTSKDGERLKVQFYLTVCYSKTMNAILIVAKW